MAGRARVRVNREELTLAAELIQKALALRPLSAASPDGLGVSPVNTVRQIHRRALAQEEQALVGAMNRILADLEELDPALLDLLPNERGGPQLPRRRGRRSDR
jgi:hypothetical protein